MADSTPSRQSRVTGRRACGFSSGGGFVERRAGYHLHYRECADLDRDDLAIKLGREEVSEFPDEPVPKTGLAMAMARQGDIESAAGVARQAVADAIRSNRFINLSLLTQARIAMLSRDFKQVEQCLATLIAYHDKHRQEDCRLEGDFLSDVPTGALDRHLLSKYQALLK